MKNINEPNSNEKHERLAYTVAEAAELLGVSIITLYRLTKRGLLKPSRATRRPLYPKAELERFLKETSMQSIQ